MSQRSHIVYVSSDGMLEPLGTSQVLRYVRALAGRGGMRFTVVSLEKGADRAERDGEREEELARLLAAEGIGWERGDYEAGGGPAAAARNVARLRGLVREVCARGPIDLVHARSYVAAAVARSLGLTYLFDIRGYWVDERLEQGRWFDGALRLKLARIWERDLYQKSAAVVSLTVQAAEEIKQGRFGPWPEEREVEVIPTCVDYGEFGLGGPGDAGVVPAPVRERLRGALVVGMVGAISQAYCVEASVRLFEQVLARRPEAHLLCLTRQAPALLAILEKARLDPSRYTITSARHDEMASWLSLMDWGLLLRKEEPSHRAAMPTKLAEFFASGVRPVQWGCNREVRRWVERAQSGVVLEDLSEAELRRAADVIAASERCMHTALKARWMTQAHFDLSEGVRRYAGLYERLVGEREQLRVLFLTEGKTVPASRYRVEQLIPHLEARGMRCEVRAAYGEGYNRLGDGGAARVIKLAQSLKRVPWALSAAEYDVVFLQRLALPFSGAPEALAAARNPRAIFDVDDAIFRGPDGGEDPRGARAFEQACRSVAHVICGNEYIGAHVPAGVPTSVIPTVVDTQRFRPPAHRPGGPVVVGWMGTRSNFKSLELAAPLLKRLVEEREDVVVRLISNGEFLPLKGVERVEQRPWSAQREVAELQGFDVGIMPLPENAVTRGKCGFKLLLYMACGVPVVASAVGANRTILEGSRAGVLAETMRDFETGLRELIDSSQLRVRMGRRGRRRVEEQYSVEAVIERYVAIFQEVAGLEVSSEAAGAWLRAAGG
ncbi:glycosyltransferase [Bradymonadales bacterium TMQ1]|nr:glycosyltransferase [Bradymonadales bacterium TMQ1]